MFIISLILAVIAGGLVGGGLVLADKIGFYLIVVFPLLGGTIIGFAAALPYLGRKAASSNPTAIGGGLADVVVRDNRPAAMTLIIIALLGAIIASGVYWAGSYLVVQEDFISLIQQEDASITREQAAQFIDLYYQDTYNTTGFPGFLQEMAASGISINRASSSSSGGITLQGNLVYIYWAVEILLIAGFAIGTALSRGRGQTAPQVATAS